MSARAGTSVIALWLVVAAAGRCAGPLAVAMRVVRVTLAKAMRTVAVLWVMSMSSVFVWCDGRIAPEFAAVH